MFFYLVVTGWIFDISVLLCDNPINQSKSLYISSRDTRRREEKRRESRKNDRDHILWHAKTGEYCPEEGSINGVVRFVKLRSIKHT